MATPKTIEIVRATPDDASALSAIARAAKAHWGYPTRWLKHWEEALTITPAFIAAEKTFKAIDGKQPIGFYALLESNSRWLLEHLWVSPNWIGRGIGRTLFRHAVEQASARGAPSLTIEADPKAEPFYHHMGAVRSGMITTEIEGRRRDLPILTFNLPKSQL